MLNTSAPNSGIISTCEPNPTTPWRVYMLREGAVKWVPVALFRTRNEAWQHVEALKKLISTAYFDVVCECEE